LHRAVTGAAAALAMLWVGLGPARADWLVTREGAKVEIKGPWTVKGKSVTFTLPNGTLASMRLAEVNLEASAAATAAAAAAKTAAETPAAAPAARTAVMVLTDADVAHTSDEPAAQPAEGAAATATDKPADTTTGAAVTVTAWDKDFSQIDNGVVVTGTVRNNGKSVAAALNVEVRLYDDKGELVSTAPATLSAEALEPGAAARFRAVFPGVLTFMAAKFDIDSTPISKEAPTEAEPLPPG
jgi:hypothetical protein